MRRARIITAWAIAITATALALPAGYLIGAIITAQENGR